MSIEVHKDLVRRLWYQQFWDEGRTDLAEELFIPEYKLHISGAPGPVDREAIKGLVGFFRAAFGFTHAVHEIVGENNTVAARWTVSGIHTGEFQGVAPTGNPVRVSGLTIYPFVGGKIQESWVVFDSMTLLQQIGAVPASSS